MSSTCFEPEGPSSGRWLYVRVWRNLFTCKQYKQSSRLHGNELYHNCTYNRLPEDESRGFETCRRQRTN